MERMFVISVDGDLVKLRDESGEVCSRRIARGHRFQVGETVDVEVKEVRGWNVATPVRSEVKKDA